MDVFEVYDIIALQGMNLAAVEGTKRVGAIEDTRWSPLIAVLWGMPLTFAWGLARGLAYTNMQSVATALLMGIFFVGLGSVGLYSGTRNVLQAATAPEPPDHLM